MLAAADVHNVGMDVYPVDAQGLVPDRLGDFHLEAFYKNTSWSFETNTYEDTQAPGQLHEFLSFIDGAFMMLPPQAPQTYSFEELRQMATAARTPKALAQVRALWRARRDQLAARRTR